MSAVFVFGSNLAGRHGGGAAREAVERWGAIYGQATGRQGDSYAIPTKNAAITETLSLEEIQRHVEVFLRYAAAHPTDSFLTTAIGCGLAGLAPEQIRPMFHGATENVFLSAKLVP